MQTIELTHALGSYAINIGTNLIAGGAISKFCLENSKNFVIITDENVKDKYAVPLQNQLSNAGNHCMLYSLPAGEQSKTRATKAAIEDQMLEAEFGRDTTIIAVGGGVITDIAGFVAATYCRGIKSVYVPTTFLAMVDAAIGGKTGINTKYGKNLIGSFYQPTAVFCDITTLATLTSDTIADGLVESIKHALIFDNALFNDMTQMLQANPVLTPEQLQNLVYRSCHIKSETVMQDERESGGIRQTLNFGHTVAHAIEKELNFRISHGQAVLAGLWVASCMSVLLGKLDEESFISIQDTLNLIQYDNKLVLSAEQIDNLQKHMVLDKKSVNHQARFIILDEVGSVHSEGNQYSFAVPSQIVHQALELWSTKS